MAYNYIPSHYITNPLPAIRSGAGGEPKSFTQGGVLALGDITFADNPTAADTITLNGIYVEFTASASDETADGTAIDPILVNIKASLDLTLDELVIVTQAAAHAALIVATYTKSGTTILVITYDTYGTAGNAYTLAASADTPSAATLEGGQEMGIIPLDTEHVTLSLTQDVDQYFTLADGVPFQRKTIAVALLSGSGNAVVTPANFTDGTTMTFDAVNEYAELQFIVDAWKVVGTDINTVA